MNQAFIHGDAGRAVTADARLITQRLRYCPAQHNARVLIAVVVVHFDIPVTVDLQGDSRPESEKF
jgi:predicted kinase